MASHGHADTTGLPQQHDSIYHTNIMACYWWYLLVCFTLSPLLVYANSEIPMSPCTVNKFFPNKKFAICVLIILCLGTKDQHI
jgi:hypothetical protein